MANVFDDLLDKLKAAAAEAEAAALVALEGTVSEQRPSFTQVLRTIHASVSNIPTVIGNTLADEAQDMAGAELARAMGANTEVNPEPAPAVTPEPTVNPEVAATSPTVAFQAPGVTFIQALPNTGTINTNSN